MVLCETVNDASARKCIDDAPLRLALLRGFLLTPGLRVIVGANAVCSQIWLAA